MFELSNMLKKSLATQPSDMYEITCALMGYINADPKFKTDEFDQAVSYVLKQGVSSEKLYQAFNSEYEFVEDQSKWDSDYYSLAIVYLKKNFCKKRIDHVKAIAKKLYTPIPLKTENSAAAQEKTMHKERTGDTKGKKTMTSTIIATAAVAAAVVLVIIIIVK